jgi:peptide chain release factor 3
MVSLCVFFSAVRRFHQGIQVKQKFLAKDKYGQLVFPADSDFTIQMTQNKYPKCKIIFTSEFE